VTSTFPATPDNIRTDVVNTTAEADTHPALHNQLAGAVNAIQSSLLPGGALNTSYSVKAYGAVGDGVADDTAAIQAAITAAWAVQDVVFIPSGRYLISSPLTVPGGGYSTYGFGIVGVGPYSSVIVGRSGGSDLTALLQVGTTDFVAGAIFRDFALESGTGHTTGHGLVAKCQTTAFENVRVANVPQDGIRVENTGSSSQFQHLTNCSVWSPGRDGLYIDTTISDTTVDRLVVGFYTRRGIYARGGNCKFVSCHAFSAAMVAGTASFFQDAGSLTEIIGGQYESGDTNIVISGASDCSITGASVYHFSGTPTVGIRILNTPRAKIVGCQSFISSGTPNVGIQLQNATEAVVANNTLHNYQTGIQVSNTTSKFVLASNMVTGCTFSSVWIVDGNHGIVHNNIIDTNNITEAAPSNYNMFHDNQLNGRTCTVIGANSLQHNNIP
jgi:hypothetical protein